MSKNHKQRRLKSSSGAILKQGNRKVNKKIKRVNRNNKKSNRTSIGLGKKGENN